MTTPEGAAVSPCSHDVSGWDRVRFLLLLALAFLVGSSPIRNSDWWRHLAAGRAVVVGESTFGADPFSFTSAEVPWINHSWLADVAFYAAYEAFGDGVVVLKALLVALLAGGILAGAGPRGGRWMGAVALVVALMALAPYAQARPALLSMVFLSFTFFWMQRIPPEPAAVDLLRLNWPLLLGFALWANVDADFWLGPLLVGLFCLDKPRLWLTLMAGLGACLLNPHHYQVFTLPDVWRPAPLWGSDPASLTWDALTRPQAVPFWAFGMLVLLGALSLVAHRKRTAWDRLALWVLFLFLAIWNAQAVPWFVVLSAPILARNFSESTVINRRPSLVLEGMGTVFLLGLTAAAWPGWLQGTAEPRSWRVLHDDALVRSAARIAQWRSDGSLSPKARILPLSLDAAHYLEWFAPGEKVFLDGRLGFFPSAITSEFQALRQGLAEGAGLDPALLNRWRITHLLLHDPSDRWLIAAVQRLGASGPEWSLVHWEGRALVFARSASIGPRLTPLDPAAWAFGADTPKRAPVSPSVSDSNGDSWLATLLSLREFNVVDQEESLVALAQFQANRPRFLARHRARWEATLAAEMIAAGASPNFPGPRLAEVPLQRALLQASHTVQTTEAATGLNLHAGKLIFEYLRRNDDGPAEALLLAIRAGRRALKTNPDDALAWLRLGQAYVRLAQNTRERAVDFPLLQRLRKIQALATLQQALRLNPDLIVAHELLARLYQDDNTLDLAWRHLAEQVRLTRSAGPRGKESAEQFTERFEKLQAMEQQLGKQVRENLNWTEALSFNLEAFGKARLAESKSLALRALQILLRSTYAEFGREGAILELNLLLQTGKLDEVRTWMEPAQEAVVGTTSFHWLRAQWGAAAGDYFEADDALRRMQAAAAAVEVSELGLRGVPPRQGMALVLAKRLLDDASPQHLAWRESPAVVLQRLKGMAGVLRHQAELSTLRGLLALEHGDIPAATRHFQGALDSDASEQGPAALARHFLGLLRQAPAGDRR